MKSFVWQAGDSLHAMQVDESSYETESAFEMHVLTCLSKIYPQYICIVFGGSFDLEGERRRADLALVAKDFSHWFVIEVELLAHSFDGHVLPQIRALRYGDLSLSCAPVLSQALSIDLEIAKTIVDRLPRQVAVISNGYNEYWSTCLRAIDVQYLTILPYRSSTHSHGYEVQGELDIGRRSLGFGCYDAISAAVLMPANVDLPSGGLSIEGPDGVVVQWTAQREGHQLWLLKVGARLEIAHQSFVQIMRSSNGKLSLRV